jgi:hypothetical protein
VAQPAFTTSSFAWSAAISLAVPPVTQPPHVKPTIASASLLPPLRGESFLPLVVYKYNQE